MKKCKCYDEYVRERSATAFEKGLYFGTTGKMIDKITETVSRCNGTKECEPCKCGGDECKCDFYPDVRKEARNELAKKAAEEREKAEPRFGEWISVKDRLPIAGGWVIVYPTRTVIGDIAKAYHIGDGIFTDDYYDFRSITHWMPLPEPPKESED